MQIEKSLRAHIEGNFGSLNNESAAKAFPPRASLSMELNAKAPAKISGIDKIAVEPAVSTMFATASVDMWLRATHSFLISTSLTELSAVWSSVSGYYSSHYSIRALAHLTGYFQLHKRKKNVRLHIEHGQHVCEYTSKSRLDREHLAYWKEVKSHALFISDPLFNENIEIGSTPPECAHREAANYSDHLPQFPTFNPLDRQALKNRIQILSGIEFTTPRIPDVSRYPDLESVQVVAYHRLVRYRDLVDSILGGGNRFWTRHRNPVWATDFMDFQLTPQAAMRAPSYT